MKIQHLTNTNPAQPKESILRIFDFVSSEACQFRDVLSKLANGSVSVIDLSGLAFVTSIDGCRLILKAGMRDKGLNHVSSATFECTLTKLTWENAEGLVEPFCEGNLSGYQWLYDLDNDIEFLFSPSGDW
jgi:hypothetical protein